MPGSLTKAHTIATVAEENGYSRKEAAEAVENLIEIIKKTLESGDDMMVSGFGKFCIQEKEERRGWNSATGDDMILKARRVVKFSSLGLQ